MKTKTLAIIDYEIGNVFSVFHAIQAAKFNCILTRKQNEIMSADGLILPGVGAFGNAMEKLRSFDLDEIIFKYIETGKPFLGICVGMQVLMTHGEEFGTHKGLNIIEGLVSKIETEDQRQKIPFIGWRKLHAFDQSRQNQLEKYIIDEESSFYFVHSYAAEVLDKSQLAATYTANNKEIAAIICKENVCGVQFHPERSGPGGLKFLRYYFS